MVVKLLFCSAVLISNMLMDWGYWLYHAIINLFWYESIR